MGNKCQCMCSADEEGQLRPCFKKSSKKSRKSSENVLPGDLHSCGGQKTATGGSLSSGTQRPDSLSVHSTHRSGTTANKFPAFSLHGVQKTSPTPASGSNTPQPFGQTPSAMDSFDVSKVEALFNFYCDDLSEEEILADGIERFCQDLDVDPTEFTVLALVWKFKAETMCKFTKSEFMGGFCTLQCCSMAALKSSLPSIESDAVTNFKDFYRYTFQYALDADQGQRSLPCDIAIAMWRVVFAKNSPTMLESWFLFLNQTNVRGISRDTWNMFLYLTEALEDDLSNYNDKEAWPSLFDDFVEHRKLELAKQQEEELLEVNQIEQVVNSVETSPSDQKQINDLEGSTDDQGQTDACEMTPTEVTQGQSEACTSGQGQINAPTESEGQTTFPEQSQGQTSSTDTVQGHAKVNLPGAISSSAETTPQEPEAEPWGATERNQGLPRVPSSPGQILNHLHSERNDSETLF